MIIASAQIRSLDHNLEGNLDKHLRFAELAAEHKADLILFPETSLTGYTLDDAAEYALTPDDARLNPLRSFSSAKQIHIAVGAPVRVNDQLHISTLIFHPNNSVSLYTKHYLHPGEERVFAPNHFFDPQLALGSAKASFAVCADITNPLHPAAAHSKGSNVYFASIFYTPRGIAEAYEQLGDYSRKYSMTIVMSNLVGESYSLAAAGQSAVWHCNDQPAGQLDSSREGILLLTVNENECSTRSVYL